VGVMERWRRFNESQRDHLANPTPLIVVDRVPSVAYTNLTA